MKKSLLINLLVLLAGASLTLAFAPFNLWPLAVVATVGLLACWLNTTPRKSFFSGWLFGVGFFGSGVSWVYISLHTFGEATAFFAALTTLLLIMSLALYVGIVGYLFNRLFPKNNLTKIILAFPALWVLQEWLRSWFLTGFPWLLIGDSQLNSPLRGLAPLFGIYGVSWAVVFTSALLVSFFIVRKCAWWIIGCLLLIALWAGSAQLSTIHWTQPKNKPLQVSLIQGNIPQTVKWQPQQFMTTLNTYFQLTSQHWDSALIIWPEAAIATTQLEAQPYLHELNELAKQHQVTLITGIPLQLNNYFYNGLVVLGANEGTYLKRHLVPFGEYLPMRWLFGIFSNFVDIPMADLSAGPLQQKLLTADGMTIAPYICYEIAYPEEMAETLQQAQIILVLTDDSWFGKSIASQQHLQIAAWRAIETGREVLTATNNGITAIIGPDGKIIQQLPRDQRLVLTYKVQPMTGTTPWLQWQMWPFIMFSLFSLLIAAFQQRFSTKNKP